MYFVLSYSFLTFLIATLLLKDEIISFSSEAMSCWTGFIIIDDTIVGGQSFHRIVDHSLNKAVSRLQQSGHEVEVSLNFMGNQQNAYDLPADKALVLIEADSPGEDVPLKKIQEDLQSTITMPLSDKGYKIERFVFGPAEHVMA